MEVESSSPLASLVKRPKPLHSDRNEDEMDLDQLFSESERLRRAESKGEEEGGEASTSTPDLRKAIQKKRKKRSLKLRLGHTPRLVEERDGPT